MVYAKNVTVDGMDIIKDDYFIIPVDTIKKFVKTKEKIPYRVPKCSTLQHIANDALAKQLDVFVHNATPEFAKKCYTFSEQIYENVAGPEIEIFDALMFLSSLDNVKENESFLEQQENVCHAIYEDAAIILSYVKTAFKNEKIFEKCFKEEQ